jgi:hypothetical protein
MMNKESGFKMRRITMRGKLALGLVLAMTISISAAADSGPYDGGGGPIVMGAMIDFSELQGVFENTLDISPDFELGDDEIFIFYGGGGFGGADFRVGGVAAGNEWTFPTLGESPFDSVQLSFDIQGFWVESFISEAPMGGVSVGALLGWADIELRLVQDFSGSFEEFIKSPPLKFSMSRDLWFVQPFVSAEIQVLEFMALKVTGGYWQGLSFGEWHLSDGQSVPGGPMKNIGFPYLQFMILFGG